MNAVLSAARPALNIVMLKSYSISPKKRLLLLAALCFLFPAAVHGADNPRTTLADLAAPDDSDRVTSDWLIVPVKAKTGVYRGSHPHEILMTNGLIRRTWRLSPDAATVALDNLITGESLLRSVRPEALVELDGVKYSVGGLDGQRIHNYLDPRWLDRMTANPAAFRFASFRVGKTIERFPWKKRAAWMPQDLPWPPPGASLTLSFSPPPTATPAVSRVRVNVHYEMYDGLPLLSKWITVENAGGKPVRLQTFVSEILAVVEAESVVDPTPYWQPPTNINVETDYTFGGMSGPNHGAAVFWVPDPLYGTQVNYERQTPCLLQCRPPRGPDQVVPPGGRFTSFRAFELPYDSTDRERRGLEVRRMYRTVAPWVTENPILMHVRAPTRPPSAWPWTSARTLASR